MHRTPRVAIEQLESRRLLAVTPPAPPPWIDDPEVIEAREALEDANQQLIQDQRAGRKTIVADQLAIRAELKELADEIGQDAIEEALQPLRDQLRADEKAKFKELRAANEELRLAKREGRQLLAADFEALREAHESGDQAAIDAAEQKLKDDREQIQEDLKPIRDEIIAIKDKWRPIITADHEAIESKLEELNPDLVPLFDKLEDDAEALKTTLDADLQAVADARQKLRDEIEEWKEEHEGSTASA